MKLKINYQRILSLIWIPLIAGSCAPVYYAPNSHNVPMLSEKHEAIVSVSLGILEDIGPLSATDLQLAMAVSDNVGIMANGAFTKAAYDDETVPEFLDATCRGQFFELGGGYFRNLDESLKSEFMFETYGGIGFGKYTNTFENGIWPSSASYQRFFIQPSMGFKSKYFEAGISFRMAGLNYSNYRISSAEPYMPMEKFTWLFEPAVTIRAGIKSVKLQWQVGISTNLNNPGLLQSKIYTGFGLVIRIRGMESKSHAQNSTL